MTFAPANRNQHRINLPMSADVDQEYAEQEALIVERGHFEETLITNISPLVAPKIKGGKTGGFGKSLGNTKAEGKEFAKVLKKEGVVRIDNVLSSATADRVRDYLYALREQSEKEVQGGTIQPIQRFATVLLKKNRCDLTVPLGEDDVITQALEETLVKSPIGATISNIFGNQAVLHELSCLMSDSGSQRQVIHPDTPYIEGKDAVLYTCFIALQDVALDMGPTVWLLGTNNKQAHIEFKDEVAWDGESKKDALIRNTPAKLGLLQKGSCAIFDSRTLHCGTANTSGGSRALFYYSFKNAEIGHTGNPPSIRRELKEEEVSLGELMKDLKGFSKGKGTPLIDRLGNLMR